MPSRCIHGNWGGYCLACKRIAAEPAPTPAQLAEKLDHTPLTFGKYRGKTPSAVAETEEGAEYIVWLFDTVKNKPTCSETLARDCGWTPPITREQAQAIRANTGKTNSFDHSDFDDDIPF